MASILDPDNPLANMFFFDGLTAEDFYYVLDAKGKRRFFSRRTGKSTSMSRIPPKVINDVKERPQMMSQSNLLKQRDELQKQLTRLQDKIAEIDQQLNGGNGTADPQWAQRVADADQQEQHLKEEALRRQRENDAHLNKIFADYEAYTNRHGQAKKPPQAKKTPNAAAAPAPSHREFLEKLGIITRQQYHAWLLKNHTDKGGTDKVLCQDVLEAGHEVFKR